MTYSNMYVKKVIKASRRKPKQNYQNTIKKVESRIDRIEKTNKTIARDLRRELKDNQSVLDKRLKSGDASRKVVYNSMRAGLETSLKRPKYNPANVGGYVTMLAAKSAGVPLRKTDNNTFKAVLKGQPKERVNEYKATKKSLIRNNVGEAALRLMGAYEKTFGINGKVANSDEVMNNIIDFVKEYDKPITTDSDSEKALNDFVENMGDDVLNI